MLKININNLHDGEHNYDFVISPTEFDFKIDFVEIVTDVFVNANLYKTGGQIAVNVEIKGKFKLQCDRCLEDYVDDFENEFDMIYKFDYDGDDIENEDDDIKFISPKTNYIDLKNDVRDYILLSVPMRKVPEEKDGVCFYCHKDTREMLNIRRHEETNPVWEKLIKAKTK